MTLEPAATRGDLVLHIFSTEVLANLVCSLTGLSRDEFQRNRTANYLAVYLETQAAATILLEPSYPESTSDGSARDPRIHFFTAEFELVEQHLLSPLLDSRVDFGAVPPIGYLGYMVVRSQRGSQQAHRHFIGRTLLSKIRKPLPGPDGMAELDYYLDQNECAHPAVANLIGHDFDVEDTVAFQEREPAVGSCGTMAIWAAIQVSQNHYGTPKAPSPEHITRVGKKLEEIPTAETPLEDLNLTSSEMIRAIHECGYNCHSQKILSYTPFRSYLYGYLRGGFPVIMNYAQRGWNEDKESDASAAEDYYLPHAVLVNGFTMPANPSIYEQKHPGWTETSQDWSETKRLYKNESLERADPKNLNGSMAALDTWMPLLGRRIVSFCAHDDQVGPFSRLRVALDPDGVGNHQLALKRRVFFDYKKIGGGETAGDEGNSVEFVAGPTLPNSSYACEEKPAYPDYLFAIVDRRVKLEFGQAIKSIQKFHKLLRLAWPALFSIPLDEVKNNDSHAKIGWDVYLTRAKSYKHTLRNDHFPRGRAGLYRYIKSHVHPQFFWRGVFVLNGSPIVEVIVDATTDLQDMVNRIDWYDAEVGNLMANIYTGSRIRTTIEQKASEKHWAALVSSFNRLDL